MRSAVYRKNFWSGINDKGEQNLLYIYSFWCDAILVSNLRLRPRKGGL